MTPRQHTHALAETHVEAALAARGCPLQGVSKLALTGGLDLVAGGHAIAVRAAHLQARQTTVRTAQRVYRYRHPAWVWNLHHHGERRCQPDVWVFLAVGADDRVTFPLIVPGDEIGPVRRSVQLWDTERHRARTAALLEWVDRWDAITARQEAA